MHRPSVRPIWLAAAIAWAGVIFALSSLPGARVPGRFGSLAHFVEYAVLGALLFLALTAETGARVRIVTLIASAYAASDEFHQSFVPGRFPDPADWGLDTLGALAGALVLARLLAGVRRRR